MSDAGTTNMQAPITKPVMVAIAQNIHGAVAIEKTRNAVAASSTPPSMSVRIWNRVAMLPTTGENTAADTM